MAWIAWRVPLTYDEAWNYLNVSSLGVAFPMTHYPAPNNHVLFSISQALLAKTGLVKSSPLFLRAGNVVVVFAAFALLLRLLLRSKIPRGWSVALAAACLFCSPTLTTYLFVGRGYLLGSTLLLGAALAFDARRSPVVLAILVALATYTVPTFGFVVPGICVTLLVGPRRYGPGLKASASFGIVWLLLIVVAYWPIHHELFAHRTLWNTTVAIGHFSKHMLVAAWSSTPEWMFAAALTAAVGFAVIRRVRVTRSRRVVIISAAMLVSFLVTVEGMNAFALTTIPFWRNAGLVPLFITVAAIALGTRQDRSVRLALWLPVLANGAFGVIAVASAFGPGGNPLAYPGFRELSSTPLENVARLEARPERIACEQWAAEVCTLYAPSMPIVLRPRIDSVSDPSCAVGRTMPPEGVRVSVEIAGRERWLCY